MKLSYVMAVFKGKRLSDSCRDFQAQFKINHFYIVYLKSVQETIGTLISYS